MAFTDRIKEARTQKGLTQEKLAQKIGVAKTTYTGYEKGNSEPSMLTLTRIMKVLEVDANFLFQDEMNARYNTNATPQEMENLVKKYRTLDEYGKKVIDGVLDLECQRYQEFLEEKARWKSRHTIQKSNSAGHYPIKSFDIPMSAGTGAMAIEKNPETVYLVKEPPHGADFIAPVKGDSMEPDFHDGDMVFVQSTPTIEVGQVGVFLMDGEQYIKELGDGILISRNPKYKDISFTDDIRCWGLVLGICDESYFE